MFIETEGTPNPATLKFLPGRDVMGAGTADFAAPETAARSPLATSLFALDGVARVFLGGDFITVTKHETVDWQALRPQVLGAVMEHFVAGRPAVEGGADEAAEDVLPEDREVVDQIKDLLDTRVRPAVAGDGGVLGASHALAALFARHSSGSAWARIQRITPRPSPHAPSGLPP